MQNGKYIHPLRPNQKMTAEPVTQPVMTKLPPTRKTAVGAPEEGRVIVKPLIFDPREKKKKQLQELKINDQILHKNVDTSKNPSYESTMESNDSNLVNFEVAQTVQEAGDPVKITYESSSTAKGLTYEYMPSAQRATFEGQRATFEGQRATYEATTSTLGTFGSMSVSVPVRSNTGPNISKTDQSLVLGASAIILVFFFIDKVKKYFSGKST